MGLFGKKKPAPVAEYGYQDAVDYLRDLEQADYTKILKVVSTYREADKKVKKILNIKDSPLTAVFGEVPAIDEDDDTELGNFLDDKPVNPKPKVAKKKPAKKITVKD